MRKRPGAPQQPSSRLPSLGRRSKADQNGQNMSRLSADEEVIRIRASDDRQDPFVQGILSIIHEFLIKNNFVTTVEVFQKEMLRQAGEKTRKRDFGESLIETFDEGNREGFFEVWNKYIPMALRMNDEIAIKLEFFIHLYFTIYQMHPALTQHPLKPNSKQARTEIDKFKAYLDRQGNELSKMPDLLAYFALVMVKDPIHNPTFSRIFSREWVVELRTQLSNFIDSIYSPQSEPLLVKMYQDYHLSGRIRAGSASRSAPDADPAVDGEFENDKREYIKYVQKLETTNMGLVDILQDLQRKYKDLQRYVEEMGEANQNPESVAIQRRWATFSNEILKLAKGILQTASSTPLRAEQVHEYEDKIQRFDNFLSINITDLAMERQTPPARPVAADRPILSFMALDYKKIKGMLSSETEDNQEAITSVISALKKRIAKGDQRGRRQTIFAMTNADLFELNGNGDLFIKLMHSPRKETREEVLKLFNLMCTNAEGRGYLTKSERLIDELIHLLKSEDGDTKIRRRCLGILQNLSLRQGPQKIMIRNGLVETCFVILDQEKDRLCSYSLDYFTALLMNLCLRREGREACEALKMDIFDVLENMLHFESNQVRTFVNGILFSLLTSPKLKKRAQESNFLDKLRELKDKFHERFQKQIEFILERAVKDEQELGNSFEEENPDELGQDEDFFDGDISIGRLASEQIMTKWERTT